jgi:hypothetical protein
VGAQFEYIDMGDAEIDKTLLRGDYKTNEMYIFAFNFNYAF